LISLGVFIIIRRKNQAALFVFKRKAPGIFDYAVGRSYGNAMNHLWCDSVFGILLSSCETSPEAHGDSNWSLIMLALVPLILAWYFFVRFLSNAKD
jgi:hypothetical protein